MLQAGGETARAPAGGNRKDASLSQMLQAGEETARAPAGGNSKDAT